MNAALDYFLKANLFLVLFYGCYWLWLRKHTFFRLNRVYLLAAVLLSLVLPFIELPTETVETIPVPVGAFSLPLTVSTTAEPTGTDWETIGYFLYGSVTMVILFRLLIQVMGVGRLIRRSERHEVDDYTLVLPSDERVPTFSFFRYLVLCRRDAQLANTPIVAHELVHIRQGHSFDVLLLEVVQLVFWLNPVLILYKQSIQQVHEFLADDQAEDKHQYATFLIDYAFGVQPNTLTNGFFKPSLLKERIKMLHRRTTSHWALGKYLVVLPLLLSLLAMTTAREQLTELVTPASDEKGTVSGKVTTADGQPLAGATLIIRNTTRGAQTDAQGRYELKNVPSGAKIVASHVGYGTQVKDVSGNRTLDFTLTTKIDSLRTVTVVGYPAPAKPSSSTAPASSSAKTVNKETFTAIEQNPEFPGGMPALGMYLSRTLRYPAEARQNNTQGRVFVQFTIGTNGDIYGLRVQKGIGSGCDEEAVRVVSQMPRWNPGMQSGQPVSTQYVLPIEFVLEKDDSQPKEKRSGSVTPDKMPPAHIRIDNPAGLTLGVQPLYVIDGKKMESAEKLGASIKPDDIASVNVLKGSLATTQYGDEGKNGVVQVTTRQKEMGGKIQQASHMHYDGKPTVYMLDAKTVTQEEFRKLNPDEIESVEVDHTKSAYTIKASTRQ